MQKTLQTKPTKNTIINGHIFQIIRSGKINAFVNLIKEQNDIDEISLYGKDLSEPNFELLLIMTNKIFQLLLEDAGIKHLNDPNAFIKYLNTMDDVYENIDGYNPSKKKN